MFFDRKRYVGLQTSNKTFSVSVFANYGDMPSDKPTNLYITDSEGNEAAAYGYRSADDIHIICVFGSTELDNAMPTFPGEVEIISTVGADFLNRHITTAGVVYFGQSNGPCNDEEDFNPAWDYEDPRIREYAFDVPYLAADQEGIRIASNPLHWPNLALNPNYTPVSSATHFAKALIEKAGWGSVDILPCNRDATSTADWGAASELRLRMLQIIENWLTMPGRKELTAFVFQFGETNALFGTTQASFETWMENFKADIIAEILSRTGIDISNVPWLIVGLAYDWYIVGGARQGIQNALESAPYRMRKTAFVTADNLPQNVDDAIHHTNAGQRILGRDLLLDGWYAAIGNENGLTPAGSVNTSSASETDSAGSATPDIASPPVDVSAGSASETDSAGSATPNIANAPIIVNAGAASETDSAPSVTPQILSATNFGPFVLNDANPSQDTQNGVITTQSFDNLNLKFTFNGDTNWAQYWCYFPNDYQNNSAALLRLRLQPGDGNLNVIMSERNAAQEFVDIFTGSIPYTLSTDIPLRITRNNSSLVRLLSGATSIGSGTHPNPIAIIEGLIHFGNTTAGSEVTFKDIELLPGGENIAVGSASETDTANSATPDIAAPASSRPLTSAIAGGTAFYAEEGVTKNGSNHMLTWADYFGNNDMTFVNGGSDQILDAGADGINLVGAVQYNRSGRVGGGQMNGAAGTMIARFKGTQGFIIASDQNALNLGDAVTDSIYHMGAPPTEDLTSYSVDDNAWHEIAIAKADDGTTNVWLDGSHIVVDAAGTLVNSAAQVVIGTTTFNFYAATGNLSMLYFNKGLALNAAQVANVLSERVVV